MFIFFRWNFVVHGCIDGYSRLVTHLSVATNNFAETSLNLFTKGVEEYGIPSRIRVDGGSEFNHIETFMNLSGNVRCIRGKSVHNQRIERLWRDVFCKVIHKYYLIFSHMEDFNIVNLTNDIHLFSLHYVYQSRIERDLQSWRMAHNEHKLRTESNQSPLQLWYKGCLVNQAENTTAMNNIFRYGREERLQYISEFREMHDFVEPDDIKIVLSRIPVPLTCEQLQALSTSVDVLAHSDSNGIDIYGQVVNYINLCIQPVRVP